MIAEIPPMPADWHDQYLLEVACIAYLREAVAAQDKARDMMEDYLLFKMAVKESLHE